MRSSLVFSTISALAATASAQRVSTCTQATITITSAAQATDLGCEVVSGTLYVDDPTVTEIVIDGPKQINSLVVTNAAQLVRLTSPTINSISGIFNMTDLNALSYLEFSALRSVGSINWISLNQLSGVTFGTEGVTKVNKILISDTFISTLDGLSVASVDDIDINNNRKLVAWDSDLVNITSILKLQNNGGGAMVVNMPKLNMVNNMEIRNVQEFNVPALESVAASLRFEENDNMISFTAANLTAANEISFTDNKQLTNISFPLLERTTGALTIQNNTALETIDGFPKLKTVEGTLILRGSFTEAELPALQDVFGQGTITSTEDISSSCDFFDDLISSDSIQGDDSSCTSSNAKANEGGDEGTSNSGSGNGGEGAAGIISANRLVVLAVAAAGAFALL
jgi:hypothetical protein